MLDIDEVADITGHEVGGVCPFGLKVPLPVYCDVSLKAFDEVVPAAGSTHSAVRIAPARMAELTGAEWIDVCVDQGIDALRPIGRATALPGRRAPWEAAAGPAAPHAGTGFEHRAARAGKLRGVLPQARLDPATSGIWSKHRRQTSGVQAIRCSKVPRYSSAGGISAAMPQASDIARVSAYWCNLMPEFSGSGVHGRAT